VPEDEGAGWRCEWGEGGDEAAAGEGWERGGAAAGVRNSGRDGGD